MAFETLKQKRNGMLFFVLFIFAALALSLLIAFELVVLFRHDGDSNGTGGKTGLVTPTDKIEATGTPEITPVPSPTPEPWIAVNEDKNTIETRFNPPNGYTRVSVEKGSFAEYLRTYPLKPYGEKALLFSGAESDEASTLGVFKQIAPLNKNQQCADTVIMLYGEYLYSKGRIDDITFNFSSGFKCDFRTWAKGYRDKVSGNTVEWVLSTDKAGVVADDYSYDNFIRYIKEVYVYANTDSLAMQFPFVNEADLKIGDVIIGTARDLKGQAMLIGQSAADSISYGHAILIADMAVNEKGEKVYLFIEGTTPATECCVVENPDGVSCCWFKFDSNGTFVKGKSGILWKTCWGHALEPNK